MNISETITWPAVNWPTATTAAAQYAIFHNTDTTPTTTSTTTSKSVQYEDTQITIFLIRPTDGTNFGPAQAVVKGNGISPTRAWIRAHVRKRTTDRQDTGNQVTVLDDEINDYIAQAVEDYSLRFPLEDSVVIPLIQGGEQAGAREYQLPADCREVIGARYTSYDNLLQKWLKPLSFKGGDTTPGSLVGYPKLGILVPPGGGRYYGEHYDIWQNTLILDFDPLGTGDTILLRYKQTFPVVVDDVTPIRIPTEDLELLALFTETKVWEEIEGKDVSLSRWRGKDDGGRRDDLPTEKMSSRVRKMYELKVAQRLSIRPKKRRLVRSS